MEKKNNNIRDLQDIRAGLERIKSKEDTERLPDNARQELWRRIVRANEHHDTRYKRLIVCLTGVAAAVALIFVIAKYTPKPSHDIQSYIIYNIATSLQTPLTLSDGTQVWVNSGSVLTVPDRFDDKKREISVSGEVFVDVAPDSKRPFTVKTNGLDITVKGTRFNVKAYPQDENTFVVLEEGSVLIGTKDGNKMEMHPEQMFTRNNNTGKNKLETVNVSEHIAWKDGYYYFYKQNMDAVLTKISEHYGIQIKWDSKVAEMTCSGKLDMKTDYTQTLDALSKAAPIQIKYKNNQIHIGLNP